MCTVVHTESPVLPNPMVSVENPTTLLLKWSPPFLWPGYHIDYFIVSTINKTDGHLIVIDRINTTFNDVAVKLIKSFDGQQN